MATHRSIEISRRIYARLLIFYPASHRADYGADMLQLFTDQCRDTARSGKRLAFLRLWLRTLGDLVTSALREHLTAPHSWAGLLEAPPNAPLPWKGVALVLLPGLLFFIAQVTQLTGEDWFFLLKYRAAYFMIIPVLAVWAWKRKFPIWGLMPLGLLFDTVLEVAYGLPYSGRYSPTPVMNWLWRLLQPFPGSELKLAALTLCSLMLLLLIQRRVGIPRAAWGGLAAYLLMVAFLAYRNVRPFLQSYEYRLYPESEIPGELLNITFYYLYDCGGLLVLILLGALLARRHGRLAVLLPLGYLLPDVIYGRVSTDWPSPGGPSFTFMLLVSLTVIAYRFVVALVGPLWIVRSASGKLQRRASAISLLAVVGIPFVSNLAMMLAGYRGSDMLNAALDIIAFQLPLVAALFLALTLYRVKPAVACV